MICKDAKKMSEGALYPYLGRELFFCDIGEVFNLDKIRILKGQIIYTKFKDEFEVHKNEYLVAVNDVVEGIYERLPDKYAACEVEDYKEDLIIPSFSDLHVHASQYMQMGIAMDLELIEWLTTYTFKEEMKFWDITYAKMIYERFVRDLYRNGTRRVSAFATIHKNSTMILFEEMKKIGLMGYVGKVNMDRNAITNLEEETLQSIRDTFELIIRYKDDPWVKPIITPRFSPTCSDQMLKKLGDLANDFNIPVQSHLSENEEEVAWVKELFPGCKTYADTYDQYGLFGNTKTLMAHGIHLQRREIEMIKEKDIYLVHCPNSNLNLSSGIMKVVELIDQGAKVVLGTDVGAGNSLSIPKTMVSAIQCSKMLKKQGITKRYLKLSEAFYMATKGGGSFFGEYGSFEPGYYLDPLIIESDSMMETLLTPLERLQRYIYAEG